MKPIAFIFSMLAILVFNVNGQNTDVKGLLDNQETRTEIFSTIAGDHKLMMDFMKVAREKEHGAMMMQNTENHQMEKMESKKGGMMEMKGNHQTMGMMKDNPEMMKMCMQKMKEKGMMHSDGKMMNIQENSNHKNHNH